MESLELPQDIIWEGDQSPSMSPSNLSNASTEQVLIFEDSFATELMDVDYIKQNQTEIVFSQEEFEQLFKIQQDLLDNMAEESEVNDQWLDQPINVPLDEYAPIQDARVHPVKVNTAQLLNEFNQVYGAVELNHLTPPETPPHTPPQTPLEANFNDSQNQFCSQPVESYELPTNQQFEQCKWEEKAVTNYSSQAFHSQQLPSILEQAINLVQQSTPIVSDQNIDDALAEVEALVRSRAEDFAESSIDDDNFSSYGSSSCFSPRSESSSFTSDDSEFTTKTNITLASALKAKQAKNKIEQKRRPRKNRRSPEDRQSRKKEQNKSAANRYRQKKKAEVEILQDQERELLQQNQKLQTQFQEVCRESKYIKGLLRDVFKAKGMI